MTREIQGLPAFPGFLVMMHLSHQRAPEECRLELRRSPSLCSGWKFHPCFFKPALPPSLIAQVGLSSQLQSQSQVLQATFPHHNYHITRLLQARPGLMAFRSMLILWAASRVS